MKIAIIGAGFCGLALAYYLSQQQHQITLIDKTGIGAGASGIAAGLLHPYVGFKGRLNWRGHEALNETRHLLEVAGQKCPLGILRIPRSEEQWSLFQEAASQHDDVEVCSVDHPGILAKEGILIHSGVTVNCTAYLKVLWEVVQENGCAFKQQSVSNLDELQDYDSVIICHGPLAKELLGIRLKLIKGQLLRFEWPQHLPPLRQSIVSKKYVVMDGETSCWVGGTYEHDFEHENPDQLTAQDEILADLERFIPALAKAPILDCQSGIRTLAPDRRPFYKQFDKRTWVFTGMGSKGLLYHAMMAKELATTFC